MTLNPRVQKIKLKKKNLTIKITMSIDRATSTATIMAEEVVLA